MERKDTWIADPMQDIKKKSIEVIDIKQTKILIDEDVANELIKRKKVGNSYSDVIRKLLKEEKT